MTTIPTGSVSDLQAAVTDAVDAVARLREKAVAITDAPLLNILTERVAALLDECAWESGLLGGGGIADAAPARLDHVGLAVVDLRDAAALYGDLLGGRLVGGGRHDAMAIRSLHYRFPGGGKVELLAPTGPGALADSLADRGPGLHHLTFFVPDVDATAEAAVAENRGLAGRSAEAGWNEVYLRPGTTQGCLVQLVTAPGDRTEEARVRVDEVLADEWQWINHRPARWAGTTS